jgi:hypothetical protein
MEREDRESQGSVNCFEVVVPAFAFVIHLFVCSGPVAHSLLRDFFKVTET